MDILQARYTNPIEREYEAWIIRDIEDYFASIHKKVIIYALSPMLESAYPADEIIGFNGKMVGLQFKKASLSGLRTTQVQLDYSNLFWTLGSPPGQFNRIKRLAEIYYCLPTFINRDYRRTALHHCLFWRPEGEALMPTDYWYHNPSASKKYNKYIELEAMRWGSFIEQIKQCTLGRRYTSQSLRRDLVLDMLLERDKTVKPILQEGSDYESYEGLYAMFIEW